VRNHILLTARAQRGNVQCTVPKSPAPTAAVSRAAAPAKGGAACAGDLYHSRPPGARARLVTRGVTKTNALSIGFIHLVSRHRGGVTTTAPHRISLSTFTTMHLLTVHFPNREKLWTSTLLSPSPTIPATRSCTRV
jgi:hypothetical protein